MNLRRLGRTGLEVSPIGLGTLQFANHGLAERMYHAGIDQDGVDAVVKAALHGGVNWFDTAEMYGRGQSERMLSTALRHNGIQPGEVRGATKWSPGLRTASNISATIGDRLEALQGYPIDLHQIHLAVGSFSGHRAQLRKMAKLQQDGVIGAIGVSNFSARQLERAVAVLREAGLVLSSNQVQINLLHRQIESNGVLEVARRHGVTLIAYSPLASGLLTGRFHADPASLKTLSGFRRHLGGFNEKRLTRTAPLVDELRAIAASYDVTAGQVALNWLITFYGDTVVAIPGASKPSQAAESAAAMDFQLTRRELDRLAELSAQG
ncbi:MAG: aldo/keto reductase [Kribbellaceae bacterium]|nr:aldo/keto reductase [Kribbellaceae bacterium]